MSVTIKPGELEEMTERAQAAYEIYLYTGIAGGRRSILKTARLAAEQADTVRGWSHRYRWVDRALKLDKEEGRQSLNAVMVAAAAQRLPILDRLTYIAFEDPSASNDHRLRAISQLREIAGLTPGILAHAILAPDLSDTADAPATDAELQAMIDAGDTDALTQLLKS